MLGEAQRPSSSASTTSPSTSPAARSSARPLGRRTRALTARPLAAARPPAPARRSRRRSRRWWRSSSIEGELTVNLGLVHAEANQFVEREHAAVRLRDPQRAPRRHALPRLLRRRRGQAARGRPARRASGDERWTVRVEARDRRTAPRSPGSRPARSPRTRAECGRARLAGSRRARARAGCCSCTTTALPSRSSALDTYDEPAAVAARRSSMSATTTSAGDASRAASSASSGTRRERVVQMTNDVNFAELAAALERDRRVLVAPAREPAPERGAVARARAGLFLTEFGLLGPATTSPRCSRGSRATTRRAPRALRPRVHRRAPQPVPGPRLRQALTSTDRQVTQR